MIYRRGWVKVLFRYELEKKLKTAGFDNWKQIVDFFVGDEWHEHPGQYTYQVVDNKHWRTPDTKWWQRLNRLWFVPLYCLTIPVQWLIRGKVGFESESKLAALLVRLTGLN